MTKLLQQRHLEKLRENWGDKDTDQIPVVKLFLTGTSWTWLIVDVDPEDPDYAFGLADIGHQCVELGYISLTEIQNVTKTDPLLQLERDYSFSPIATLSVYAQAGRTANAITTDKADLETAYEFLKRRAREDGEAPHGRMLTSNEIAAHFAKYGGE